MRDLTVALNELVQDYVAAGCPAAVIVAQHQGKWICHQAWGWIDPQQQQHPATTMTLFDLASVTKLFTTTAYLALVRAGKVYGNLMVAVQPPNAKLRDRAARLVGQVTGLDNQAANDLLMQAAFEVKTAIVTTKLKVDAAEAGQRLRAAGGYLRGVID